MHQPIGACRGKSQASSSSGSTMQTSIGQEGRRYAPRNVLLKQLWDMLQRQQQQHPLVPLHSRPHTCSRRAQGGPGCTNAYGSGSCKLPFDNKLHIIKVHKPCTQLINYGPACTWKPASSNYCCRRSSSACNLANNISSPSCRAAFRDIDS